MNKKNVHEKLCQLVAKKYQNTLTIIEDLKESLITEQKSSVGDKHETSRSMIQIEMENVNKSLIEIEKLQNLLMQIQDVNLNNIQLGSLFKTNSTWFYYSIPFEKINIDGNDVFFFGKQAPIATFFQGKKIGDKVLFNKKEFEVLEIL